MDVISKIGRKGQGYASQLQGQAAVWQVASQLAMRGHVPLFPGIDYGYDLKLENGLRLQVKSSRLKFSHPQYRDGYYSFDWRKFSWDSTSKRIRNLKDYSKCADFFVCWGVDDNRFWIFPCSIEQRALWFPRTPRQCLDLEELKRLVDSGITYEEVANQFGVSRQTISRYCNGKLKGRWYGDTAARRLNEFQDRWDLLDATTSVRELIESSVASEV